MHSPSNPISSSTDNNATNLLRLLFSELRVNVQSQLALSFAFVAAIIAIFCFFAVPVYNQVTEPG